MVEHSHTSFNVHAMDFMDTHIPAPSLHGMNNECSAKEVKDFVST